MNAQAKPRYTEADYLRIERAATSRSEFYRGEFFAMTGASRQHNVLAVNLTSSLHTQLRHRPCNVFTVDMRVRVSATGLYTYPDLVVTCEKPEFLDAELDTLLNPQVLVEILSKSTESYDRGAKFAQYRQLPTLKMYVLVSQDRVLVETFTRDGETWVYQAWERLEDTVPLPAIDCALKLSDVYEKVDLDPVLTSAEVTG